MRVPRTRVSAPARAARGVATAREGDAGRGRSVRARSCAGRAKWCPARPPRPFRGIPTSAPKVRRFRREFGGGEFQIRSRSDGRFRGAREGSGTSSFSRPRARDSWLGNAAPLGAFGDASRAWILSPANQLLSARAARGHDRAEADVGESARRGGVSRAMSAARAASGASASASVSSALVKAQRSPSAPPTTMYASSAVRSAVSAGTTGARGMLRVVTKNRRPSVIIGFGRREK